MHKRVTVVTLSVYQSVSQSLCQSFRHTLDFVDGGHIQNGHQHKLGDYLKVIAKCGTLFENRYKKARRTDGHRAPFSTCTTLSHIISQCLSMLASAREL